MTLGLDLDALAALERAATPGEWLVALNGSAETCLRFIWRNDYGGNLSPGGRNVGATRVARDFHEKDAALTAALRNAAPSLLAAAREAERLREALREIHSGVSGRIERGASAVLYYYEERSPRDAYVIAISEATASTIEQIDAASPQAGRRGEG